jgi:hypothetical protein
VVAWRKILFIICVLTFIQLTEAHQLVLTTGYANSRTPEVGSGISRAYPPFRSGGGYAVGIRADIVPRLSPLSFGPAFLFWNNLTGDPDPNADATYFQIEMGGRASLHTPGNSLYAGIGVGYSLSHGTVTAKADGSKTSYDGDFPTGSVHFGFRSPSSNGVSWLGEGSFHFGLEKATGRMTVGPAKAWLIQLGLGLDIISGLH